MFYVRTVAVGHPEFPEQLISHLAHALPALALVVVDDSDD
jgi:hypothetical protein